MEISYTIFSFQWMGDGVRGHSSHSVMPHAVQDINKEHVSVIVPHHNTEEKLAMETLLTS